MDLSDVKERIRRVMKREDITVESAAEAAGVSQSTVRRWCNPSDDTDIGLHAFSRFAFQFDLSVDALMFPTAKTDNGEDRDVHREWRANMDWWEVHLTAAQKEAVMACLKAVWQVSEQTTAKQLRMTDPGKFAFEQ
jgi:transcriptional regulator with XRE-family HTH domain